jgi:glycosyltransferase involved in cell wall biosynthesis
MASALPTVSIVIPAYNEEDIIRSCVLAALHQTVAAHEIIVVDNRSTDSTAAIVAALQASYPDAPLKCLRQDAEQGIIPTRNVGFDQAQGDVIGRIDADSVIEPNWVEAVQVTFSDPEVAASTGPVIYYDMPLRRIGHKADDTMRRAMITIANEYRLVFGSNMALRASAWREIRSEVCRDYADDFHEDIDLSIHLHEAGLKVAYSSDMVAGMSMRRIDDSPREYYNYMMRFERTYQSHNVRNIVLRAPMWLFMSAYPALKAVRKNQARTARLLTRRSELEAR